MVEVKSKIKIHEVDGEDWPELELTVESHKNSNDYVVLKVQGHGQEFTVAKEELETAIKNATNTARCD